MTDPATLKAHAALFDQTAERLGVDLETAALAGNLSIDEISEAVLRCTACSNPTDCRHWLMRDEVVATAPPVYCCNTALLSRLAGVETEERGV